MPSLAATREAKAERRASGDDFASIDCHLMTRLTAPREHIRHTILFLESYIIPGFRLSRKVYGEHKSEYTVEVSTVCNLSLYSFVKERKYDSQNHEKSNDIHEFFTQKTSLNGRIQTPREENTDEAELTCVQCRENIFGSWRCKISFDHSDTVG